MLELVSQSKVFEGWHKQYSHLSTALNCTMRFAVYLPPGADEQHPAPVLYWLSGLTCTDENFMQKAAAFQKAAELGIAIVAPDTSPRGDGVADDPDGTYDLGLGAGFYVNSTQAPWKDHYQMYSYVVSELPKLIEENFPVSQKRAIAGHSMGGHGALVIGMKNSERYRSISAFSPICNPVNCPWGQKAFTAYLGDDKEAWKAYDAVELMKQQSQSIPIRIDQGEMDSFLEEQLKPWILTETAEQAGHSVLYQTHPGYDHSYFFIQSFIGQHLEFHAQYLKD
jgi:S-formylglutathione hydrolase